MSTAQNHMVKPTHANKAERKRIEQLYQELHTSLDDYISSNGASHCTQLLEKLYLGWSLYHFGDDSPETTPIIQVNKKLIEDAYSTVEFMAFITRIGETWSKIQSMETDLS
ncbi:hypothetical protein [Spirosoma luteum]|uniref:hypothetical protein n=1 Tax=Spirosoma luteum TaxID=431553 RepID=UPI00036308E5|nr:hypothetical protein [Spirosoma luteum]